MNIELPVIDKMTPDVLAVKFSETELCEVIAYLGLVLDGSWHPGPEMFRLGISPVGPDYNTEHVEAVQRRCGRAVAILRRNKNGKT